MTQQNSHSVLRDYKSRISTHGKKLTQSLISNKIKSNLNLKHNHQYDAIFQYLFHVCSKIIARHI